MDPQTLGLWAAAAAGGLSFLGALIKVLVRAHRFMATVEDTVPVLLSIAKEFKPDSGHSLRDVIDAAFEAEQEFVEYVHERYHDLFNIMAKMSARQDLFLMLTSPDVPAEQKDEIRKRLVETGTVPDLRPLGNGGRRRYPGDRLGPRRAGTPAPGGSHPSESDPL